ncbi:hypothetical protein [Mycolicibacterium aichiense]|uniref:Uncharacterized protein n=1 Tax=Mycolicibacterium aichiense TaxID=1799 RepID=A0AAD1HP54_9MYCO|nr:hypothetical protein [Mycolicibacterium aichiense]MCV7020279.1 hypothetical protein [Mycolicibacterium aichiense]BBX09088.1 hypothetical protein MAIC_38910 [Mycolicibacterium aichiense]STZ82879.1 Uncharacterised protein [Mycolicibacterium aichiense]
MNTGHRTLVSTVMLAAATCAALIGSASAAADPGPGDPVVPVPVPPNASVGSVLAQSGEPAAGPLGLPDLSVYAPGLLLGQNPVPSAPGAPNAAAPPDLRALNNDYLLAQNVAPAAPGQGEPDIGIGPSAEQPGTGRLAFLRRLHAMYSEGALDGALLGQVPYEQLGEPLPGTAPGPEVNVPPGLGFALADPAVPAPPP